MKSADKFIIRPLTAVNAFNYEIDLPIYDGVVICYRTEEGTLTDLITLYCGMYDTTCTFKVDKDIKMCDFVSSYDDFKALDATIEKAKYHIELAHQASITAAYTGD